MRHAGGDASFFLWLALPAGETSSEAFAARLLDRGVLVAPGRVLRQPSARATSASRWSRRSTNAAARRSY